MFTVNIKGLILLSSPTEEKILSCFVHFVLTFKALSPAFLLLTRGTLARTFATINSHVIVKQ